MHKKLHSIMAIVVLTLALAGNALAAFENLKLVRVVLNQTGGTTEIATDLGTVVSTGGSVTSGNYGGGTSAFTAQPGGTNFSNLHVAYFAINRVGSTVKELWITGVDPVGATGKSSTVATLTAAIFTYYNTLPLTGTTISATADNSNSYRVKADQTTNFGAFGTFINAATQAGTEAQLTTLASTSVTQDLYYFANYGVGAAGVKVATITTHSDGSTNIDPPTTPIIPPTVTSLDPAAQDKGAGPATVTISGTGFESGATVTFSGGGITTGTVAVANATTITVPVTISAGAATGARNVTVANADGGSGTLTNGFTVNAAVQVPTITTWPTAAAITFGQTLASATLSGGAASTPGSFAFTAPTTAPAVGSASQGVTFTPTDIANFSSVSGSVNVTVNKATPIMLWPTAAAISYGQTLASASLTGGTSSTPGSFAFTTPTTAPAVGTAAHEVTFTPTDTTNFNTVTGSVNVTVNKATPSVIWPTAAAISYGQTLASVSLSGGSATTPGIFAFTAPATAPAVGTAPHEVTLTPLDTTNYSIVTGSVSVTVNKTTPSVTAWPTAAVINFGQTLASATLTGGATSTPGIFAFTAPATAPAAGTVAQGVTFTPTDTTNYSTVTGTVSVTVNKATPSVSAWPTAAAISFGQTLASATLSGGTASTPGTFAFTTPTTAPPLGTAPQGVTFTPTDSTNYSTVTGTTSITVNKATPSVTAWPTAAAISFGQTLASATLSGGTASTPGAFAFTTPTTAPAAGNAPQGVTFTPTDSTNYSTVTGTVSVTVNKATPSVTAWPTAAAISYGQTLASATLTGGTASKPGSFAFTTPTTVPALGTAPQGVTFTPTDAANYASVTGTTEVTVNKAAPNVTAWPTAAAISYGQTLASATLTGGTASKPGNFAFTTPTTVPALGTAAQGVTFTPTDSTNYSTVTGTVSVTVNKATPGVSTWPTAAAITFGQTLASATLTGGAASTPGSFAFTTPPTVLAAGTATQGVTFTPTDAANYASATGTISVTVNKATLTIIADNLTKKVGSTDPVLTYSTSGFVNGNTSTVMTGGLTRVAGETVGTYLINQGSLSAGSNYTIAYTGASLTITDKTVPVITWTTPAAITYGTPLSVTQLNASATVPGTFAYSPLGGSVVNAGSQTLTVTFIPTDVATYAVASATVTLTVNKATPSVTAWPTAAVVSFGQTLASATLTGGTVSTTGTFTFTTSTTAPAVGTASHGVTFTPTDTANFISVTGTTSVTVDKATPTVATWPTAAAINFGQTLAITTLTGGTANTPGSFAFTTPTTAPAVGSASQGVTFTPTDTATYASVTGTVSVTVNKATPSVTAWPTAAAISFGQTLASATLSGATASIPGAFAFTTPTTAPAIGPASQGVTFTPTDTVNYASVTGTTSVTVNKATPSVTAWPTAAAISFGQTLASATLTGGTASTPGTFAFTTPTTAPAVGSAPQGVTFTPTDMVNYASATGTSSVTVNKATPSVTAWPTAAAINFGQTLASTTLSGGTAGTAGSFAFTTPSTIPAVGSASQGVTFTPTNVVNFASVTGTVSVTVNQSILATPNVTAWPTTAAITLGQTLASATLTGGTASTPGSFSFTTPTTAPAVGTSSQVVIFIPTDAATYASVTGTVSVTVNKTTPSVTAWPTAAAIGYGQTLASATLTGGAASTPGTFAFTTQTTAPAVGTASQGVTFTPTDTATYASVTGTVTVTVNKATPNVTAWPIAAAISYGQTLTSATLTSGTTSTPGSFAFTTPTTAFEVGTASQGVTFTPTDTASYTSVTGTVNVAVNQAVLTITADNKSKIIGTADPVLTYTATGFVNGNTTEIITGSLTRVSGAAVGNYAINQGSLSAGSNYTIAYTGASLETLDKTVPVITWPTPAAITYGTTLTAAQLNASSAVAGTFTYNPPAGSTVNAGAQTLSATFTPTDTDTYASAIATVNLVVNKVTPVITWNTPAAIDSVTLLTAGQLNATASVAGSFVYSPAAGTLLPAGTHSLSVTFTPGDQVNYSSQTATVSLTVVGWNPSGSLSGANIPTIGDALRVLRSSVGLDNLTALERKNADVAPLVNGKPSPDGRIDIGDALVILKRLVGSVPAW